MAVKEDDHVKKTYYKIYGGKVVREWYQEEAPEGFSNLTKRVTEESKKTVWYKPYIFSGVLTNAFEKKNDRINAFQFHIEIDGDSVLVMNSGSGYHKSFLLCMENFPTDGSELTFSPYNFPNPDRKDKRIIGMNVLDDEGNKIENNYTKEKPNGLPQPTKNKKGEWNWTKQEDFLDTKFEKWHESFFAEKEVEATESVDPKDEVPF